MSPHVTVVTPENIEVRYRAAGFTSRFAAALVDLALQFLLALLVIQTANVVSRPFGVAGMGIGGIMTAIGIVALFLVVFAYAIFFEMVWGGRTPGKRVLGLRVVRDGGLPITFTGSMIRNALRFLDFGLIPISPPLVLFGLPGLLSIFLSPTSKRLGDYAAGTVVIVETSGSALSFRASGTPKDSRIEDLLPWIHNLDRLTHDEYLVLRRFAARRPEMDLAAQAALGEHLARPLLVRLEIPLVIVYQLQFADVVEAIERRYAEEHGLF